MELEYVMKTQTLAERIVSRRLELGLLPVDLAHAAGVSISAVMQWESGATKNLKLDNLIAIADALNVHPRWLASGQGPKEAEPRLSAYRTALKRRDHAESEKDRRVWERIAAAFAKAATVLLIAIPPLLPTKAEAAFNISISQITHWRSIRRRLDELLTLFQGRMLVS